MRREEEEGEAEGEVETRGEARKGKRGKATEWRGNQGKRREEGME